MKHLSYNMDKIKQSLQNLTTKDDETESCAICNKDIGSEPHFTVYEKGCNSINALSKSRGDTIFIKTGQKLHKECRRVYCHPSFNPKLSNNNIDDPKHLRSRNQFNFKENCLFCGKAAKCYDRKRGINSFPVRTKDFQKSVADVCNDRNDDWANEVNSRLQYAQDLHAYDAVYHQQCSVNFRTMKNIPQTFVDDNTPAKVQCGRPENVQSREAFEKVVGYLIENEDDQISVSDLSSKMVELCGEAAYSRKYMKKKLIERFKDSIIISEVGGKQNVVTLRATAASILYDFYNRPNKQNSLSEKLCIVETAAKLVKSDILSQEFQKQFYPCYDDVSSVNTNIALLPETLQIFLRTIFSEKDAESKIASIGQAIMQAARPRSAIFPLQIGLGVQMHRLFASKFLIDALNSMGFSSSYTEVQKFEVNAAASSGTSDKVILPDGHFGQFIADNVDHNVRTLDGNNTFHGMGIIAAITPGINRVKAVPRTTVSADTISSLGKVDIYYYSHSQDNDITLHFENLPDINAIDNTHHLDLLQKIIWPLKTSISGWSGMMQMCQEGRYPGKSSFLFLPMIDLDPSNLTCIYSTLKFICKEASSYNAKPVITFDQPLYWKALSIILSENPNSEIKSVVLRLGGFHMEMSYLGCIGQIMGGSGINELLETVYAPNPVEHMMTGKAYARAIRGHSLVANALNTLLLSDLYNFPFPPSVASERNTTTNDDSPTSEENVPSDSPDPLHYDLSSVITLYELMMSGDLSVDDVCSSSIFDRISIQLSSQKSRLIQLPTAKLWINYLDMLEILRKFIKAERTGDWKLHLQSVRDMLPIFAAAGHNLYLKSAYVYLQMMLRLEIDHPDIYSSFIQGHHVLRRSDRYWAGLSTDLVIEQVLMRSVKSAGGLTRGRGINENQRTQWLLSMPACMEMNAAMQTFTSINYATSEQHKESSESRKERDLKDTLTIVDYLKDNSPFSEETRLYNISTKMTADSSVNAHLAREVGEKVVSNMIGQNALEYSFKKSNRVVNMNSIHNIKVDNDVIQIDPQLLFQRLVTAANLIADDASDLFRYELSSYPSSIFDTSGLLREAQKPSLANAIWSLGDCSPDQPISPGVKYVIDGGSLLQRIPWQRGATFGAICRVYVEYIQRRFDRPCIVFDGYTSGPSTKDVTHQRRTKGVSGTVIQFTPDTPCKSKKEQFLANTENKQNFINMLSGMLEEIGCATTHAPADADFLMAKIATEYALSEDTVLLGEDTDLLVLLLYHASPNGKKVYFKSDSKQHKKVWDILKTQSVLGQVPCSQLLYIHALTGCDTTSRIFGIGKNVALKCCKSMDFQQLSEVFAAQSTKDQVIDAGEKSLVSLYNGKSDEQLNFLRFRKFNHRISSGTSFVQVHSLPPTSSAAQYHSLRVYYQVQQWLGNEDLDPLDWGWKLVDDHLIPLKSDMPPAPDALLKIIKCNCKNCDNKRCTCRKHGLSCSYACGECHGTSCSNSSVCVEDDVQSDSQMLCYGSEI